MGRKIGYTKRRKNKVSKRRNTNRKNKVSKRKNKVSKRRNRKLKRGGATEMLNSDVKQDVQAAIDSVGMDEPRDMPRRLFGNIKQEHIDNLNEKIRYRMLNNLKANDLFIILIQQINNLVHGRAVPKLRLPPSMLTPKMEQIIKRIIELIETNISWLNSNSILKNKMTETYIDTAKLIDFINSGSTKQLIELKDAINGISNSISLVEGINSGVSGVLSNIFDISDIVKDNKAVYDKAMNP